MNKDDSVTSGENKDAQMKQLRTLVLGEDNTEVTDTIKQNAREIVSEVFSEALHDRQKQDGSVNQILVPIVEKSVSNHGEKMVGYLYPLVGRLVRKSVTAFLNEFLEKTNELIENSLTIKGLKWRFRAWQAGVSFAQYVASQTFIFKVEQVLLIHRETGILLHTVSDGVHNSADADMVSGMLTAINDFVSDSFSAANQNEEQHLDVVKTDDFTLLITQGPRALLVAAVTGNMPQGVSNQLQLTLESIHRLHDKELSNFEGETEVFDGVEQQLRECLVAELKPEVAQQKKRPWFAFAILTLVAVGMCFYAFSWYQQNQLRNTLLQLDELPGIMLTDIEKQGLHAVKLQVLRDPDAIDIPQWLAENSLESENILIKQRKYLSLDEELFVVRLEKVVQAFPEVSLQWQDGKAALSGELSQIQRKRLFSALSALPDTGIESRLVDNISVRELENQSENNPAILKALLDLRVAKIDNLQIDFTKGQSTIDEDGQTRLESAAEDFKSIIELAEKLNKQVGLIIMGASDSVGGKVYNQQLSKKRALAAQSMLVELGIEAEYLNAIGLGVVEVKSTGAGARKVLFNVIYFDSM